MADEPVDVWLKPYERSKDTTKAMQEYLSWEVDLLARIERDALGELQAPTRQGQRNDLKRDSTCTTPDVQVDTPKRRESTTEIIAGLIPRSGGPNSVRSRQEILKAADDDPEKYGRFLHQMDEDGHPRRAHENLLAAQKEARARCTST